MTIINNELTLDVTIWMFLNFTASLFSPYTQNRAVTTREKKETYVGLTATEFKTRWRNHQMSFKHDKKRNDTELSQYLWELKKKKEQFTMSWKILAKARAYSNLSKRCNLCIEEKYFIISDPQMATLNKRNKLVSTCRHRRNYILKSRPL